MSANQNKRENPATVRMRLSERLLGGGRILLERMTDEELAAAQQLIFQNKAEFVESACMPYLVAKLRP